MTDQKQKRNFREEAEKLDKENKRKVGIIFLIVMKNY